MSYHVKHEHSIELPGCRN
uniref:Uncharacterized protein n=1 Tax=Arundo donax TaxID=35708 RepID=A0A0A8YT18_ARUDO